MLCYIVNSPGSSSSSSSHLPTIITYNDEDEEPLPVQHLAMQYSHKSYHASHYAARWCPTSGARAQAAPPDDDGPDRTEDAAEEGEPAEGSKDSTEGLAGAAHIARHPNSNKSY